jgi:DNA (cytosine-5)-methyltransferase 1
MPAYYGKKHPDRRPAVAHHRGAPARPTRHPASPDPSDLATVREWVRSRSRPTAVDLFCGAGGLSLGLEQAGFDVVAGADNDAWAIETHAANLPGLSWAGDLFDPGEFLQLLEVCGIESVDLVAGGVPCQPFSRAGRSRIDRLVQDGRRTSDDPRAHLWESYITVVERLRPRAVLVENVPDLPRWDDGAVLLGFYESLGALGYHVEARILDGFRYGVPQHRQRLILIGTLHGQEIDWPQQSGEFNTLREAISDLPIIPRAQRAEILPYDPSRITSDFQREMRAGLVNDEASRIRDHITRDVRPDDLEAFSLLAEGQTYVDLPERLRRYRSDVFTDKYKRLAWGELCRSITAHIAKDGYWYIHPDQHRTLSVREAARVQTFPDAFRFAGTQTHRYRQIGNAVPVRLGKVVGETVLRSLQQRPQARMGRDDFREALSVWGADRPLTHPWREGDQPWAVVLGEVCLARARAADIPALYRQLLRAAPTPHVLADDPDASENRLRELGLKARARVAVDIACALVERFGGAVPESEARLRSLPHVGDFLAQAIRSFGFGHRTVLLDQNTARVAARVNGHDEQTRFQLRLDLHRMAGTSGADAQFNSAVLDLGSALCRPVDPRCELCPLVSACARVGNTGPGSQPALSFEIAVTT